MKHYLFILLTGLSLHARGNTEINTDTVSFIFKGKKLTGLLDMPIGKEPIGLVILVPGSGATNMVEGNGYYKRVRHFFAEEGFACYVWDKPGCGLSEGAFDDLNVDNSAKEAIAAIEELKRRNVRGSGKVGLWGLSRGGWVCPIIIAQYPAVAFWISVSGPDGEENFGYLLERNFLIEGRTKEQTQALMKSWRSNLDIARHGGTFEENQAATQLVRSDPFYTFISKGKPTKEGYLKWQESLLNGKNLPINEKTGLQVYIPGFDTVLKHIYCPVLAIFGEKDSQVDWQKAMALYKQNIGKEQPTMLTIKIFPDGNHNIFKCKTGGFREELDKAEFCDGYFETMSAWIKEHR